MLPIFYVRKWNTKDGSKLRLKYRLLLSGYTHSVTQSFHLSRKFSIEPLN